MLYYDDSERRSRLTGVIAVVAYAVALSALLLFLRLSVARADTGEGILVAFGDVEQAGGTGAADNADASDVDLVTTPRDVVAPDDIQTQDYQDAPPVTPPASERPQERTATPPERKPDPNALFPGNNAAGNDSQGASHGAGRQGAQHGTAEGDPTGTGQGAQANGFNLAGRSIVGALPAPNYPSNKSGRVIVDITVDADGRVTRAIYRAAGSTTGDSDLVNAALEAARRARFSVAEGGDPQTGTITYNFRLK